MGRGDKNIFHEILVLRHHAHLSASAAVLAPVEAHGVPLDVAVVGNRDRHVFLDDHILDIDIVHARDDLRPPLVAVFPSDFFQFLHDDIEHFPGIIEDALKGLDEPGQFLVFPIDLVALQAGEPLKPHVQDRLRLRVGEAERPAETFGGFLRTPGRLYQGNDGINVVEGDDEPFQDMGPFPGPREVENGPAGDHFLAEVNESLEDLFEIEDPGLTAIDGKHDDAETRFHLGVLVELIQDHARLLVFLQVNDNTDSFPVRLVPEVGYPLHLFFFDQFRYLFNQIGLVHEVGQFRDDNAFPIVPRVPFNDRPGPYPDRAPPRLVGGNDPFPSVDESRRGKIGTFDKAHHFVDRDLRIPDQGNGPADQLAQVVGRDIRGHTHGDAGRSVQEERGNARGQHRGLLHGRVIIRDEIDGIFFQVGKQLLGKLRHSDLRITHGGWRISINAAEIPLSVDQRIAHGKVLGHPHEGIVGGRVPVGMVFTDDIPDDPG